MKAKIIEVRDSATYIPVLAVRLEPANEHERAMLATAGFGISPADQAGYVVVGRINGGRGDLNCDPYDWCDRTMKTAHEYIVRHFDDIEPYDVVDVENILGETVSPKRSEHW